MDPVWSSGMFTCPSERDWHRNTEHRGFFEFGPDCVLHAYVLSRAHASFGMATSHVNLCGLLTKCVASM